MAKKSIDVEALRHDAAKRRNIPTDGRGVARIEQPARKRPWREIRDRRQF